MFIMGNHAPNPPRAKVQITVGSLVEVCPDFLCPVHWQALARHLKQGTQFQVVAGAQGLHGATLVLQPWPCTSVFPKYVLAPSECVWLKCTTDEVEAFAAAVRDRRAAK